MEATIATSYRSPHTPISVVAGGGFMPPPPHPPIRTTNVQTPTTLGSGTVPSMTMTIVPSIQNVSGTPFVYGMLGFDSISTLKYLTLHIVGMGEGSSSDPLQGSFTGTTTSFNFIPYSGGHIPRPSTFVRGDFQQPFGINTISSV
jgi:hypothetical protein